MTSLVHLGHLAPADPSTLVSNIGVLIVFGGMIAAGIMRGIKELRDFRKSGKDAQAPSQSIDAQVAAVTILENATLSAWTRSNKDVAEGLDRLVDSISDLRDELRDTRRETAETRHAIHELNRRDHRA